MEIEGLRAIIIGGASGFARATASRIAAGGGKVAILDRAESAGAEVAAELGGTWHPCDVLDFEGIEIVINEAVEAMGGLDMALNTAGDEFGMGCHESVNRIRFVLRADHQAVENKIVRIC